MNVRDDYAGTERNCPKCKSKFRVPRRDKGKHPVRKKTKKTSATETAPSSEDEFDPVSFLTGEKTEPKPSGSADDAGQDFDPMDVLGAGAQVQKEEAKAPKKAPPAADNPSSTADEDFDPMDVLGTGSSSDKPSTSLDTREQAPSSASSQAAGDAPSKPTPRRPSWAKPLPEPEKNDWDEPEKTDAPSKPTPRRPSWAKPLPEPEKNDWDEPAETDESPKPTPRRPSWAKPLPGEEQQAQKPEALPEDASAAAKAAASAMVAPTMASGPPPEEPRRPWIDVSSLVNRIRARTRLMLMTLLTAAVLFGLSSWMLPAAYEPPPLVEVTGRVTVDGQPLADAVVFFHPINDQGRGGTAVTDSDGRYVLRYSASHRGIPPGLYRVQIEKIGDQGRDSIPSRYGRFTRTRRAVPDGGGTIDIDIKTRRQ